jgi:carbamoyltransferase
MTTTPTEGTSGWIVGLNHGSHDPAAALLFDGELVVTVEQERLSRRKRGVNESPALAMKYCLDFAGISLQDVEVVALGADHDRLGAWLGLTPHERHEQLCLDAPPRLFPEALFDGAMPRRVVPVRHHLAHAGSAYWPSGFRECAVLVLDAMGEDESSSILKATSSGLEMVRSYGVETSLGYFFEAVSAYVGLDPQDGGKLMGLAGYGTPRYTFGPKFFNAELSWRGMPPSMETGEGMVRSRRAALHDQISSSCFPYSPARGEGVIAYADVAASAQRALQETILSLAEHARSVTGSSCLAVAGGVGLNCTANGALAKSGIFDEIFVQPMAHDAGVALGAALVAAREAGADLAGRASMRHAYWGPPLLAEELQLALRSASIAAERLPLELLYARVANIIARGGIVAWAQGRAEVGPRALGARSLLGDPRQRSTLARLNNAKGREMWRPLAPAVLAEAFDDYFVGTASAFMLMAAEVREDRRHEIPAVVHVDGSARPQAVSRDANTRFYDLIAAFGQATTVPVLVNTSLNVADEPIATSPADILRTFQRSGADAVIMEDWLALRG